MDQLLRQENTFKVNGQILDLGLCSSSRYLFIRTQDLEVIVWDCWNGGRRILYKTRVVFARFVHQDILATITVLSQYRCHVEHKLFSGQEGTIVSLELEQCPPPVDPANYIAQRELQKVCDRCRRDGTNARASSFQTGPELLRDIKFVATSLCSDITAYANQDTTSIILHKEREQWKLVCCEQGDSLLALALSATGVMVVACSRYEITFWFVRSPMRQRTSRFRIGARDIGIKEVSELVGVAISPDSQYAAALHANGELSVFSIEKDSAMFSYKLSSFVDKKKDIISSGLVWDHTTNGVIAASDRLKLLKITATYSSTSFDHQGHCMIMPRHSDFYPVFQGSF